MAKVTVMLKSVDESKKSILFEETDAWVGGEKVSKDDPHTEIIGLVWISRTAFGKRPPKSITLTIEED